MSLDVSTLFNLAGWFASSSRSIIDVLIMLWISYTTCLDLLLEPLASADQLCSDLNYINYLEQAHQFFSFVYYFSFLYIYWFYNPNRADYNRTEVFKPKPNPNRWLRFSILKTEDIWLRFRFYPETEPNRPTLSPTPNSKLLKVKCLHIL